jgi:predicted PurR-regulated permease PerM
MNNSFKIVSIILSISLAIVVFFYLKSTILLTFAACLLALVINIPTKFLTNRGLSRGLALTFSVPLLLIISTLVVIFILPSLAKGIAQLSSDLPETISTVSDYYKNLAIQYSFLPPLADLNGLGNSTEGGFSITNTISSIGEGISSIGSVMANMLIVFIVSVFLVLNPQEYINLILALVPKKNQKRFNEIMTILYTGLNAWVKTLGLSIAVTVSLVFIAFQIIGFSNSIVIALIAGLATFIPNIGILIPLVPIVIFGLNSHSLGLTVVALVSYLLIQLLESNVITPKFMKANLNILPAGILLFQIISAQVFGLLGVLLAVPILVVITVLIREIYCMHIIKNIEKTESK